MNKMTSRRRLEMTCIYIYMCDHPKRREEKEIGQPVGHEERAKERNTQLNTTL